MTTPNNTSETAQSSQTIDFPIWKTITVGTFPNNEDLWRELIAKGAIAEQYVEAYRLTIQSIELCSKRGEIDLVRVSEPDLGLEGDDLYQTIFERGLSLGLLLCPQEAGPQLRLQWNDAEEDDRVVMAMPPYLGYWWLANLSPERRKELTPPPCIFSLSGTGLYSNYGPGDHDNNRHHHYGNQESLSKKLWVFVKPRMQEPAE